MSNDIVLVNDIKRDLSINAEDISRLVGHLEMVKKVVSEVLKEGIDSDYAIVPGTKKKALLKPGAEKLMKIFGLGVRFKSTGKEMDRYENFAMFSYEAEAYHLKTGISIATCEGTANSWEKKYKERNIYKNKIIVGTEPTPISDILNTLQKMAQKRAMVGAIILATGASDYFTQDEDEIEEQRPVKKESSVDDSKFTSKESIDFNTYVIPIGKHKDKKIVDVDKKEIEGYINFVISNNPKIDGKLKEFVDIAREYLR